MEIWWRGLEIRTALRKSYDAALKLNPPEYALRLVALDSISISSYGCTMLSRRNRNRPLVSLSLVK
jgi:hypothetical protein